MARPILQAKVDGSRGINAIGLVSIINGVQVHGQNIGFGVVVIELRSQYHLFQLTHNSRRIANNQVFNELLADGAAAFDHAPILQVRQESTRDTQRINALVRPEILILGSNSGIARAGSNLVKRDSGMDAIIG